MFFGDICVYFGLIVNDNKKDSNNHNNHNNHTK